MSKKLLLADDSITIQKVIQITFAQEDCHLTITDNGDKAYERARELVPDLVLADIYMPGKNGYELCAAIKQTPELKHVPVLLLAGSFEPFDEAKARAAGADDWIEKPFESQALIDKVTDLLSAAAVAPDVTFPVADMSQEPALEPEPEPAEMAMAAEVHAAESEPDTLLEPEPEPALIDPFAGFEMAAPEPAEEVMAGATDWNRGGDPATLEPSAAPADEFVFEELGSAETEFAFAGEPFSPSVGQDATGLAEAGTSPDFEEDVLPLSDDDILSDEDLEPVDEISSLSPWSREDLPPVVSPPASDGPDLPSLAEEEPLQTSSGMPSFVLADEELPTTGPDLPLGVFADEVPVGVTQEAAAIPEAAMPPTQPLAEPAAPPTVALSLGGEELEQLVERAVVRAIEKLAGSTLERVAWEVVPDLAEALIKDEIRKIKEEAG